MFKIIEGDFKNQEYVLSSIDHFFNENGIHEKTVLSFDKK